MIPVPRWSVARFGDVASVAHGWAFRGEKFADDPAFPVIVAIGNFRYEGGFRFAETKVNHYSGEYPEGYLLRPGDLLLVMTCQTQGGEILGIPGRVPGDGRSYLHNQRIGRVVLTRPDSADLGFLYYVALSRDFNQQLVATASGSKILHTAPSRIEATRILLPPLVEQRGIAATLGALDDKIDSNRRAAAGADSLLDALADGLQVSLARVRIGDLAGSPKETFAPSHLGGSPVDHFSIPAFDVDRLPERVQGASILSNKIRIRVASVLVSRLNPRTPRVWFAVPNDDAPAAASTEFLQLVANATEISLGGIWLAVRNPIFLEGLRDRVTGTSGSHQRVRPADALSIEVPDVRQADPSIMAKADALLKLVHQRRVESRALARLRDALLPELLSGRIRVPEAREAIAATPG